MKQPKIEVPLKVGSRVALLEDIDVDEHDGYAASIMYEATVEQYVPETRLLRMSDGTQLAEFMELLEKADGIEIIQE